MYDHRDFEVAQEFGQGHDNSYNFSVYGNLNTDNLYVSAAGAYSVFNTHTSRDVATSSATGAYEESFTAHGFGGRVEAGLHLPFAGLDVTPFVAALADSISMPAHTETTQSGTSTFAIESAKHSFNRIRSELGVGINNIPLDLSGAPLFLSGRVGWAHEFGGHDQIPMAFAAFPAQTFTIQGPRPGDAGFLSAGIIMPIGPGFTLVANAEGDAGDTLNYSGSLQLRFVF
jgi:outer membrane autotransporter protein